MQHRNKITFIGEPIKLQYGTVTEVKVEGSTAGYLVNSAITEGHKTGDIAVFEHNEIIAIKPGAKK